MDVVTGAIVLNNRFQDKFFDVGAITKGLNTYEKKRRNCHIKIK